jgi:hypothetical protein
MKTRIALQEDRTNKQVCAAASLTIVPSSSGCSGRTRQARASSKPTSFLHDSFANQSLSLHVFSAAALKVFYIKPQSHISSKRHGVLGIKVWVFYSLQGKAIGSGTSCTFADKQSLKLPFLSFL